MTDYKKIRDQLQGKQAIERLNDFEYFMLSRVENYLQALEYNMKYFVFQGGLREKSLDFCRRRNNKVFSIEELLSWKDDPDRPLIENYDPILHMGGDRCFEGDSFCYHSLSFISDSYAKELRPDIFEQETVLTDIELNKSLKRETLEIIENKRAELLNVADPKVTKYINNMLNQFANEVIGVNEKLISEGRELSIEEALEEISAKIKTATELIAKKMNQIDQLLK
jgi:hypothetical protein